MFYSDMIRHNIIRLLTPIGIAIFSSSMAFVLPAYAQQSVVEDMSEHESGTAQRVMLVMVEQEGCDFCERWHEDIGPSYGKTIEGQRAPVRFVDIHQPVPDDLDIKPSVFTPTFIVTVDGKEFRRMEGLLPEDFFWGYLRQFVDEAYAEINQDSE